MPGSRARWGTDAVVTASLFALGALVGVLSRSPDREYAVAALAGASRATIVLGPLVAMWAALRTATVVDYLAQRRPSRSSAAVHLSWNLGPLVGGAAATAAAVVVAAGAVPEDRWGATVLGVAVLSTLFAGVLGISFARALPTIVAVPSVGALVYGWLALLTSTDWAALRYLSGSFATCCTVDQQPATGMVLGSSVFLLGAAVLLVLGWSARAARPVLVAAGLAAATAAGLTVVHRSDSAPDLLAVSDRESATRCVQHEDARLCTWPEHAALGRTSFPVLRDAVHRLRAGGLDRLSTQLSERPGIPGSTYVQLARGAAPADLVSSLVQGLLPDPADCRPELAGADDPYLAGERATIWLAATAGMEPSELQARYDPDQVVEVVQVRERPAGDQQVWLEGNLQILLRTCPAADR